MRYKVLDELRELSEARETIRLGELTRKLNQAKGKDTELKIIRIFRGCHIVKIMDTVNIYSGTNVLITIVSADYHGAIDNNTRFYVVRVLCKDDKDNEEKYGFNNWFLADDNGVTYKEIDNMNSKRGLW